MKGIAVSGIMLTLVLIGMLTLAFNIQPTKADTIYISGPCDLNIEGATYVLTEDILNYSGTAFTVSADWITFDGAGHKVEGDSPPPFSHENVYAFRGETVGLPPHEVRGFTLRNTIVTQWWVAITGLPGANFYGNTFMNNTHGITSITAIRSNIVNNTFLYNANYGLSLRHYNNVTNNIFANNTATWGALHFYDGSYNIIRENSFINNSVGVHLYSAEYNMFPYSSIWNKFYHNCFKSLINVQFWRVNPQYWDDGYPSGGNYWSDYVGVDHFKGSDQNETGGDGIGDTPFIINESNQDNYALIEPWSSSTIPLLNITKGGETYQVQVISNTTVVDFKETPGSIRLTVSGETGTTGYVRIIQPVGLNSSNIKVFLNKTKLTFPSIDPPRSISTNGTHHFIYFAFAFSSFYEITVAFPIEGDVNCDGIVDILDIGEISSHWFPGPPVGPLGYHAIADINGDGSVDIFDIGITSAHWGEFW